MARHHKGEAMRKLLAALGASLLLLALLFSFTTPSVAQSVSRFGTVLAIKLIATNGLNVTAGGATVTAGDVDVTTGDITAAVGDLTLTAGSATIGNDLSVTDDATFGSDTIRTIQTAITVTNGAAFTPTGELQPITSAGTVTPTITIPAAGKCYTIWPASNTSIVIVDTGNQVLGGNVTLGQYDQLRYCSDGTRIMEQYRKDN